MKIIAEMVTTVMEAHDKKSSVPIYFANIWNTNAVPAGSASSGKLVILSVKKKAMADHGFCSNSEFPHWEWSV